ncbi:agmatine deiminase family protein [Flammeovirga yaeyamensis]|uniref:Agmatine deiminase family protein n=1 Tax=Flammeovirga yaeyamensis TaxID=367791 RepID=A0AAX1MZ24_9BACT|nr:agmatine deiminase family protein [Flammeovirga yaeyamensis]MBB3695958.1 agmatine/peptidylarginine deiminase [Flammeovirga yaeyamensis]NMF34645.1 agmatine deiminase family protein [Flammeovirga yaeyamensis]QWG00526.1 agmatine deiminase family protein [Flammeovirga yaeyamensis]
MISDFETTKVYFSQLINDEKYQDDFQEIKAILEHSNIPINFLPKTNDIWARDYMPIQISKDKFIEFRYDPDYLQGNQKGYRNLKTYPDLVCDALGLKTIKSDVILDGGNVVKSRNTIILTDKLVYENRHHYSKKTLLKSLHEIFEVDNVVLIPWDKLEPYGHSDGMLRFINEETILLNHIYDEEKEIYQPLDKAGLHIEKLKFSEQENKNRNWAYINFLLMKDIILIPKFEIVEDIQALEQLQQLYPAYASKMFLVSMKSIVKNGGALNCITWTIKAN